MTTYARPTTVEAAVAFLADHPGATPVAGGTDLFIDRRLGRASVDVDMIDLSNIDELTQLSWNGDDVHIGAGTKIRALELDKTIIDRAPAIAEAARVLGSIQIRNMATVGGNICHATPSAEMPPTLLVHDARAKVQGPNETIDMALADFATGPGTNALAADQLLVGVTASVPQQSGSCYVRQTIRWSMDLAGVGAAARVTASGSGADATITDVRVALGAVAPVPMLVPGLHDIAVGSTLTDELVEQVAATAAAACSPISDARGTADYRRHVAGVLAGRALSIAFERATNTWTGGAYAPITGRAMASPYTAATGAVA